MSSKRQHFRRGRSEAAPLPAQSLEMKAQELWHLRDLVRATKPAEDAWHHRVVLAVLVALTLGATSAFAAGLHAALALHNGGTPVHYAFLAISTLAFAWIAFGAANGLIGTIAILASRGQDSITVAPSGSPIASRTALLFPVYHEDMTALAGVIRALAADLVAAGLADRFAIFILSDSQTPEARAAVARVFAGLARDVAPGIAIDYRNRERNIAKKAGNIAEWVRRHGGACEHFVVFDADSTMTVDTLVRLVATMEASPDTALIQTVPRLTGAGTLFARLQQFANNTFGPLGAAGFATWQGAAGNYWGHNAIVRTRAFAESAGLPELRGRPPWGGPIQSHDFVEAALLRRAGWRVALVTSLDGSYEQSPPTLVELAARDRRWMQGNLQHTRLLGAHGLAAVSRLHMAVGIVAYLSSAIWLAMLLTGLYLLGLEQQRVVSYFDATRSLFPNWPTYDPEAALRILVATMLVVLLPKLLGLGLALRRVRSLRESAATLVRWLAEVAHSALLAPVLMVLQVTALMELLLGRDSGWGPQRRGAGEVTFVDALRFHWAHVVIGLAFAAAAASVSLHAVLWISPIVAGLVLSPGLT